MNSTTRRWAPWVVGAVAVVGAAVLITTVRPQAPGTFSTGGVFRLPSYAYLNTSDGCSTLSPFDDIAAGTPVLITDPGNSAATLATGELGPAIAADPCRWEYTVANVPAGHGAYRIAIGRYASDVVPEGRLRNGYLNFVDGLLKG